MNEAAKGEGSMTYDGKTTSDPTYSTERVTWLAAEKRDGRDD